MSRQMTVEEGVLTCIAEISARDARIAALEAQLAERVKVKPLEWKALANTETEVGFGGGRSEYTVIPTKNAWRAYGIPGESDGGTEFFTKDAAKAAAQADYERRILSALEATPPAPKVTEDERLREAASRIVPYLRWTIGEESPGYHPTMPSAVGAFMAAFGWGSEDKWMQYRRQALTAAQEAGKP